METINDYEKPIKIGQNIWWVGYVIPDDPFQCHVYLIENGNESILIDPGSKITWNVTRKKILEIIPLENIKYIIAHHQDPDIVSCLDELFKEIGVKDRYILTHWRTQGLLKHYNWGIEFIDIEDKNWEFKIKDRKLEFIFTPYMHFPGAFCTYDVKTKTLFSSDIFGAFTPKFSLYAKNPKEYFEQMKPFHTHYMPNKIIVNHGLDEITKKDIDLIAPQHGSIIKKEMITYIINSLRELDVGIFLNFKGHNIKKLTKANEIYTKLFEEIAFTKKSSYEIINQIKMLVNEIFKFERMICFAEINDSVIVFDSNLAYPIELNMTKNEFFKYIHYNITEENEKTFITKKIFNYNLRDEYLAYTFLTKNENHSLNGICTFLFSPHETLNEDDYEIMKNFKKLINMLLLKEIEIYKNEKEKKNLLYKALTDELTGLFNRHYLNDIGPREFEKTNRYRYPFSIAIIDLDNFKNINDSYGHDIGDIVLKNFAKILKEYLRDSDIKFRYGGEEFLIIFPFTDKNKAYMLINRIRDFLKKSDGIKIDKLLIKYTFSAGICEKKEVKSFHEIIKKADKRLYKAKMSGRDTIIKDG